MSMRERQAEIIRILTGRKSETVPRLALELEVSKNTIYRDIEILAKEYSILARRGNGGGVRLTDRKRAHKHILSQTQIKALNTAIEMVDCETAEDLQSILLAYA